MTYCEDILYKWLSLCYLLLQRKQTAALLFWLLRNTGHPQTARLQPSEVQELIQRLSSTLHRRIKLVWRGVNRNKRSGRCEAYLWSG
jgi:hypothetical protein